jgi:hypothetical protein
MMTTAPTFPRPPKLDQGSLNASHRAREEGFRAWSRKRALGANPNGKLPCTVVTGAGQPLGRAKTRLVGPEAEVREP